MKRNSEFKLYLWVWRGYDYPDGMAFAIAKTPQEAFSLALQDIETGKKLPWKKGDFKFHHCKVIPIEPFGGLLEGYLESTKGNDLNKMPEININRNPAISLL